MVPEDRLSMWQRAGAGFMFSTGAAFYLWAMASICSDFTLENSPGPGLAIILSAFGGLLLARGTKPVIFGRDYTSQNYEGAAMIGVATAVFSSLFALFMVEGDKLPSALFGAFTGVCALLSALLLYKEVYKAPSDDSASKLSYNNMNCRTGL